MRNENFIIHSWQARVAPRKKKQSGYGIFYVSDFEILCSRLDKSRMLTFMNRRIRTRMFGGVGGVVLKPPYPNQSRERMILPRFSGHQFMRICELVNVVRKGKSKTIYSRV